MKQIAATAAKAGVDGLLGSTCRRRSRELRIAHARRAFISTSLLHHTDERIGLISGRASGFIYTSP
jgi:hypothetical protein